MGQTFGGLSAGPREGASRPDVVATCNGIDVPGGPHLTPQWIASLQDGSFAQGLLRGALAAIRPADRVLHLGASDGVVAAVIARNCLPAFMLAFEGDPALVAQARALHRHNGLDDRITLRHGRVRAAPDDPSCPAPGGPVLAPPGGVSDYDRVRRVCLHNVLVMDNDPAFLRHANLAGVRLVLVAQEPISCGRQEVRDGRRALNRAGYERDLALSGAGVDVFRRVRA